MTDTFMRFAQGRYVRLLYVVCSVYVEGRTFSHFSMDFREEKNETIWHDAQAPSPMSQKPASIYRIVSLLGH